jgi:hypothetical protein
MNTDITEQYLNSKWDDFSKEQMRLMMEIKTDNGENESKKLSQQLTQINTILTALMRLRNIKKKLNSNF